MHLRRSSERSTTATPDTVAVAAWDELPTVRAGAPTIKAPRAAELVAPASAQAA